MNEVGIRTPAGRITIIYPESMSVADLNRALQPILTMAVSAEAQFKQEESKLPLGQRGEGSAVVSATANTGSTLK